MRGCQCCEEADYRQDEIRRLRAVLIRKEEALAVASECNRQWREKFDLLMPELEKLDQMLPEDVQQILDGWRETR